MKLILKKNRIVIIINAFIAVFTGIGIASNDVCQTDLSYWLDSFKNNFLQVETKRLSSINFFNLLDYIYLIFYSTTCHLHAIYRGT